MIKIPQKLLKSKYRKEMWYHSQRIINKLEKNIPISSVYLRGSFVSNKKRPAGVDFIVLMKIKDRNLKSKWSVDFVVIPDNKYGETVVKDADKWMKQKYGARKSAFIKLK